LATLRRRSSTLGRVIQNRTSWNPDGLELQLADLWWLVCAHRMLRFVSTDRGDDGRVRLAARRQVAGDHQVRRLLSRTQGFLLVRASSGVTLGLPNSRAFPLPSPS
jgi:hypothetical protein